MPEFITTIKQTYKYIYIIEFKNQWIWNTSTTVVEMRSFLYLQYNHFGLITSTLGKQAMWCLE